jgi:VIT1/CCC1 family predicted Fe2+/Mn2+ transporter
MRRRHPPERHQIARRGWLRASVLGANDGIVSTSSLIVGVAAGHANHANVLLAGLAGLVAGGMSMAVGEYVSVHSQADTEAAALAQEKLELEDDYAGESHELTEIYVHRGVERTLATRVAEQLMSHDALAAHARDELGMSVESSARPVQAALASAASFAGGALLPLSVAAIAPPDYLIDCTVAASLVCLLLLGSLSAKAGGAPVLAGALRVTLWSALAMAVTAAAGALLGSHV